MRYYQQFDESDCGAACLAMVASHFGSRLSVAEIRREAGTDVDGTNIKGMMSAAKKYGLNARALKGEKDAFSQKLPTPFIAHLRIEFDDIHWTYHFVVVRKIHKNSIEIWDPSPTEGKKCIPKEQFFKEWTGYILFFEPEIDFHKMEKKGNLIFKFIPVFLPYTKILKYSFFASIIILLLGIISSFYFKYLFDEIIYSKSFFSLNTLSFGVLCLTIVRCVISTFRSKLLAHFSFKTDLQLNFSYLTHIFNLPLSFFESRKSGEILSRLGDLDKIKQTLSSVAISGLMDIIMILISGPILYNINSKLFGISIITVFFAALSSISYAKIYKRFYSKAMSQNAEVQSYLYESLNGVATVKALNAEEIVNNEYEKKKMTSVNTNWKISNIGISQELISGLINGISSILIVWIGSYSILNGSMSFGTLIAFNSLLGNFSDPLFRLLSIQNSLQESLVAAERVGEILELENERDEKKKYIIPEKINGEVVFDNITFAYGSKRPIYKDLSFKIKGGSWTAFVGPSGCGKSTIIKLLLKFYEPQEGTIYLDGNNLKDIDPIFIRSKIGYVPQDIFLFSGTIAENISLHNPNAKLEDIINAAKKAGADDFIQKLPKRYETVLGEHGGGLSGGEKQRLALARALLGNPSFIILDEATSSLDSVSEMEIHKVLKQLKKENIAVILIAHRLTTVMNCDTIFVLRDGKIEQQGTHKELLSQDGFYKEMWMGANE